MINDLGNTNFVEERKSLDSFNSLNQNQVLSSTETGVSSMRNSKDSLNSSGNNHSFLGGKIKPEIYSMHNDESNDLQLQIKDSLKKISEQYYMNQYTNNSSLFNYYCTPFLYNNHNKKEYFIEDKPKGNETVENVENYNPIYHFGPYNNK